MVILPFVLLVCCLAVDRLTSKIPPQRRTCIPSPFTTEVPLYGLDEVNYGVLFRLCGNKNSRCAAFGHPVWLRGWYFPIASTYCHLQEIFCPPETTCLGLSQTNSYVFCCPKAFSCYYNMNEWPMRISEGPTSGGSGCCAIGLRCESDLCFEYVDEMLAVFQPQPLHIHKDTNFNSQGSYNCSILATIGPVKTSTLSSSLPTSQVEPKCASQKCKPEKINQKDQDLRIRDRRPETQTAWRSKIDEIVLRSQAEEDWDGKNGKRRLLRLGCVVMALVVIPVVMFVF